ncbi:MAG: lytic transglycosylase domain-containing protein [Erythrobacter sp.]
MFMRTIAASLVALSLHGGLAAQQAQLLAFDGSPQDVVINVGPVKAPDQGGVEPRSSDLSHALAADFSQIGSPAWDEPVAPVSAISVPHWMRSGTAASFGSSSMPSVPMTKGCGNTSYRPRGDLPNATEARRARLFPVIAAVACEHSIPVGLFDALVWQESRYQMDARSPKGAIGLAQLMPGTADYLGISNSWDVVENLRGGAKYLRMQIDEFGRYDLALAAYNAGPGRVRPQMRIPRIRETIAYVESITAAWVNTERSRLARSAPIPSPIVHGWSRFAAVAKYSPTIVANPR